MEDMSFKLEVFEGPLDLLLHLITQNKVSLDDIPIALILDQYLAYLETLSSLNIEVTSEFIVMAAQLILLKSRMLLPVPETAEEDPRAELARRLAEYKLIKGVAAELTAEQKRVGLLFTKQPEPLPEQEYAYEHSGQELFKAFTALFDKENALPPEIPKVFAEIVGKESESIAAAAKRVILLLKKTKMTLTDILVNSGDRKSAVVTFIALLELCRESKLEFDDDGFWGVPANS
ncbi:MAG: segregation/condensation protein A [Oscillospiraceae bacterium]|nr:segregation/condensation protein A [Oscillospiraceae bacterium]